VNVLARLTDIIRHRNNKYIFTLGIDSLTVLYIINTGGTKWWFRCKKNRTRVTKRGRRKRRMKEKRDIQKARTASTRSCRNVMSPVLRILMHVATTASMSYTRKAVQFSSFLKVTDNCSDCTNG